jgi:hypothetical protein
MLRENIIFYRNAKRYLKLKRTYHDRRMETKN